MQGQRERILRAAILCISNLGLERTSIAEIRKEVGLSAGAIYTHFANKDEIIAEALRFAAMSEAMLPDNWTDFKTSMVSDDEQMGFDVVTIARAKLQLFSGAVRAGPLQDMLRPLIDASLEIAVRHLETMQNAGKIKLRMSALQTAMSISALTDGLIWIGLADGRTWEEIAETITRGLDCLIDPA